MVDPPKSKALFPSHLSKHHRHRPEHIYSLLQSQLSWTKVDSLEGVSDSGPLCMPTYMGTSMQARTDLQQQSAMNAYALRRHPEESGRIPISMLLTPSPETPPCRPAVHPHRADSRSSSSSTSDSRRDSSIITTSSYGKSPTMDTILNVSTPRNPYASSRHYSSPEMDVYPLPPETLDIGRRPRAPRPSYSEEQKFFIMYTRIVRDLSWPEIEDEFERFFGSRSKGGLTSVYYRVRRDWGLLEVLKSGANSYAADCREVERRAMNFSAEFLSQIGYLVG